MVLDSFAALDFVEYLELLLCCLTIGYWCSGVKRYCGRFPFPTSFNGYLPRKDIINYSKYLIT